MFNNFDQDSCHRRDRRAARERLWRQQQRARLEPRQDQRQGRRRPLWLAAEGGYRDARRHDHDGPADRRHADLHLSDHARRERDRRHRVHDLAALRAALQPPGRRLDAGQLRNEPRAAAQVLRRRQAGDHHHALRRGVVERQAGDGRRRAVQHRAAQGRGEGQPGQLGSVHTGAAPRQHLQRDRRELPHGRDHVQAVLQPCLPARRPARLHAHADAQQRMEHRHHRRTPPELAGAGERGKDLQLPGQAGGVALDVCQQPAMEDGRRSVHPRRLQHDQRLIHARREPALHAHGQGSVRSPAG